VVFSRYESPGTEAEAIASQESNVAPRLAAGLAPRGVASALHGITYLTVNKQF
jgi:hypothetical protein